MNKMLIYHFVIILRGSVFYTSRVFDIQLGSAFYLFKGIMGALKKAEKILSGGGK